MNPYKVIKGTGNDKHVDEHKRYFFPSKFKR